MRYRQLLKIAQGGMAAVHVGAVEGGLGFRQFVAIKEPHRHLLEDSSYRVLLQEEARLGALLRHTNIVSIRDVVLRDEGSVWLVMDYVEGVDFGELVDEGRASDSPIPPSAVVQIVLDAAEGLAAAHELTDEKGRLLGLIHRDISPQNILIGRDGVARVSDFGVAKFKRSDGRSTTAGKLRGKVAYMAPEYLQGQPFDTRLDVFALGVVLWEGLSGARLFRGDSEGETLLRILSHDAPAIRTLRPELPAAVDDVLAAALAKEPGERFASARAFAAALASATRGTPLEASRLDVRTTVERLVGPRLDARRETLRQFYEEEPSVASLRRPDQGRSASHDDAASPREASAEHSAPSPAHVAEPTTSPSVERGGVTSLRGIIGLLALLALALGGVAGVLIRPPTATPAASSASSLATPLPANSQAVANGSPPSLASPLPANSPSLAVDGGVSPPVAPTSTPRLPATVRPAVAPATAKTPPPNPYGNP